MALVAAKIRRSSAMVMNSHPYNWEAGDLLSFGANVRFSELQATET
jgi:hypothetical protein